MRVKRPEKGKKWRKKGQRRASKITRPMPYRGRRRKEKKIEEDGEEEAEKHRQRESSLGVDETEPKSR